MSAGTSPLPGRGETIGDLLGAVPLGAGLAAEPPRDRRTEGVSALLLAVGSALLLWHGPIEFDYPWLLLAVTAAFALASRITFPIEEARAVPTQLLLLPMLMLGPPALVPLLVFVALTAAGWTAALLDRRPYRHPLATSHDALYALAPAAVFVLAGSPGTAPALSVVAGALAAQIALDATAAYVVDRRVSDGARRFPLRPFAIVWLVDALLTPVGVAAAMATEVSVLAPLSLVFLLTLFALAAIERRRRWAVTLAQIETVTRERERLRAAVHRIGDAFASTLDLDALLTITTRAAREAVDADAARASATNGPRRRMTQRVTIHEDDRSAPLLGAVEQRAVEGQTLAHAIVDGIYAMAAPIGDIEAGGVVAVARNTHEFTVEERELFLYLCQQAGIAARNVARHASLHRQALTDDLTGLANHRRFQELLGEGHARYTDTGIAVGLILLDIDDFKRVNDTFGHQVGDQVLRNVADALRDTCRQTDEPARYGGEELAVVVADADMYECARLAERMRRALEEVEVVGPAGERITVTASFGVALMGEASPDPAALISAADHALYRAKYQGKNCVRLADDAPSATQPLPQP